MEKPILYSTDMVQALLDGRKTQTRRTVKIFSGDENELRQNAKWLFENKTCPYGKPGDLLWVREEHLITFSDDKSWITVEFKDGYTFTVYFKELSLNLLKRLYKRKTIGKWQRARFLPKELARIWLKVTNERVERLQDISEDDAKAEGAKDFLKVNDLQVLQNLDWVIKRPFGQYQFGFLSLWCAIYGTKSWEANPWLWVVEFEVVSTTGRANVKEVQA